MLRLSRAVRAQQCLYTVLGVPKTATTDEIKRAFQEKAKTTHPDVAKSGDAPSQFRSMVEAYRTLRDPKKRSEYDSNVAREAFRSGAASNQHHPGTGPGQWPYGEGMGLSEEARAKLYNYPVGAGGRRREGGPHAQGQEARFDDVQDSRIPLTMMALAGVFLMYKTSPMSEPPKLRDSDPYPARLPSAAVAERKASNASAKQVVMPSESPAAESVVSTGSSAPPSVPSAPTAAATQGRFADNVDDTNRMVWAYYDPFSTKWQRIPDGFEPPAAMDLTAWHKKRTDPVEWSRLLADGQLSEIIPRGGLKVRYRPAWDTHEPILVKDPQTQKSVQVTEKLLASRSQGRPKPCEVKF